MGPRHGPEIEDMGLDLGEWIDLHVQYQAIIKAGLGTSPWGWVDEVILEYS